jgi:hypothetical protein
MILLRVFLLLGEILTFFGSLESEIDTIGSLERTLTMR